MVLLATELERRNVRQLVITTRDSRLAHELAARAVPVRAVSWRRGVSLAGLVAAATEGRAGPCLFHAHDPHAFIIGGLAATLTRRPYVATRRTEFALQRGGFWRRAPRVIAVSSAVRRALIESGVSPERITVVHSGIDLAATRVTAGNGVRRTLGLPEAAPLAVAVGALDRHKDHHSLLAAAAQLRPRFPDLVWALAGDGPLRSELESVTRDLRLESVIRLLGPIEDPLPLIAAADVFVMSSIAEGLGTVLLDAMALGRPIVATGVGGVAELLGNGAGLLVPPRDPQALARAVERLFEEPALAGLLTETGHREVQRFESGRMADSVLEVYRSVVIDC